MQVKDVMIDPLSSSMQYGLNVFEGMRVYCEEEEKYIVGINQHFSRLVASAKAMHLKTNHSKDLMLDWITTLVKLNEIENDFSIRCNLFPTTKGSWQMKHESKMFLCVQENKRLDSNHLPKIKAMVSSWLKNSDNSMCSKVKVGANYINARYGQMEAIQKGYDLALFFNHNGTLAESGGSSVGIIKDNILYFPKLTDSVLDSVTRQIILKIAPKLNLKTQIKSISKTELMSSDEIFICGSSAEIQEITHVDNQEIVRNYSNPIIAELHKEYLSFCTDKTNYDYIELMA